MSRNLPLIVAIVSGVIAAILSYSYLQKQRRVAEQLKSVVIQQKQEMNNLQRKLQQLSLQKKEKKVVPVVVAKRDLKAGEILTSEMVEEKYVPVDEKIPSAAGSVEVVLGKQLITDVVKGEQIILSRIVSPDVLRKQLIPPGQRLVTVQVEQTDLFRFLRPGDRVDIAVVLTLPGNYVVSAGLFSDVEVKAINGRVSYNLPKPSRNGIRKRGRKESGGIKINPHKGTLTFALPSKDAAILNMAARFGKIEVYPRSRIDPSKEKLPPVGLDTVLQYALPQLVAKMKLQTTTQQNNKQQEKKKTEKKKENLFLPKIKKEVKKKKIRIRRGNQVEVITTGPKGDSRLEEEVSKKKGTDLIAHGNPLELNQLLPNRKEGRRGSEKIENGADEKGSSRQKQGREDSFRDKVPPSLDKYLGRGLNL